MPSTQNAVNNHEYRSVLRHASNRSGDKSESRPELCYATTGGSLPPQLAPIL
jgi:hypothetical protein